MGTRARTEQGRKPDPEARAKFTRGEPQACAGKGSGSRSSPPEQTGAAADAGVTVVQ